MQGKIIIGLALVIMVLYGLLLISPDDNTGALYMRGDEGLPLDAGILITKSQVLRERGMSLAIYIAQQGGRDEFERRLRADGLFTGDTIKSGTVAVFLSLEERFYEVRYGEAWHLLLDSQINQITDENLVPYMDDEHYMQGFIQTLTAIESRVINADVRIQPDKAPTPPAPSIFEQVKDLLIERAIYAAYIACLLLPVILWGWILSRKKSRRDDGDQEIAY